MSRLAIADYQINVYIETSPTSSHAHPSNEPKPYPCPLMKSFLAVPFASFLLSRPTPVLSGYKNKHYSFTRSTCGTIQGMW